MKNSKTKKTTEGGQKISNSRRDVLKSMAAVPILSAIGGAVAYGKKKDEIDAITGATIKYDPANISELKGEVPKAKIGDHEISRLVLGGNLIGGWMHSRDLKYVSALSLAYNTEEKIFETLLLAEKAGINAINIGFKSNPVLQKYKKISGSKIKVISQVAPVGSQTFSEINKAIDHGADILQIQGNWCDWLVRDNKIEKIAEMLGKIRSQGYTAGLASHTIDALIACETEGIIPDYYMKTMHHDRYWSAHPKENRVPYEVDGVRSPNHNKFHDNMFCLFPERSIEFVQRAKVPVMGFKVLAAGAIKPYDGFNWAFKNGADFICVGMFDFQIVNNVNMTIDILKNNQKRKRKWYG